MAVAAGLLLPPDVVQPFLLRYHRDDLHVMAFLAGHPDYEAVEAMIRYSADGSPSIRAIVTRHDQTQIDHVNTEALVAEARGVDRRTVFREISLNLDRSDRHRHATVAFVSYAGEQIVLDVTTAGMPSPERGGLSDPGMHSPDTSLPVMWRKASTLAGPQSRALIDGRIYEAPIKIATPHFTAHEGYYTEGHSMAVIRAGAVTSTLRRKPDDIDVGAEWIYESDGKELRYRVVSRDDTYLRIAGRDAQEIVTARLLAGRLDVVRIQRRDGDHEGTGLDLVFTGGRQVSLSIDDAPDLITGDVAIAERDAGVTISLIPRTPAWAIARRVEVACSRAGDQHRWVTTIGDGA